jgi:hypothetical protein
MKDVDYVRSVLASRYATARPDERPYPALDDVIRSTWFDYRAGRVEGESPNGSQSREGHDYLWFKHGDKSILCHRFIVAVTLGKWPPRDFDVDHINHNPSDNRPDNLRVVTRRDNAGNRRSALLSELADIDAVAAGLIGIVPAKKPEPKRRPRPQLTHVNSNADFVNPFHEPMSETLYTGETKPSENGGTWHRTNHGSWHLKFDR